MFSSGPTTTVMTHIILSPPDSAVAWMTAAPLLALMTRRDFDRINNGAESSMYIIINALVALSPSLFQRQVGFLRPGLHRRRCRSWIRNFRCAPNDLPSDRISKHCVYPVRRYTASFTFLAPTFPLGNAASNPLQGPHRFCLAMEFRVGGATRLVYAGAVTVLILVKK